MRRVPILILGLTVTVLSGCSHRCHSGCQPIQKPFRNFLFPHRQTNPCETCGFEVLHATDSGLAQSVLQSQETAQTHQAKQSNHSIGEQSAVKRQPTKPLSVGTYAPLEARKAPAAPLSTWPTKKPPVETRKSTEKKQPKLLPVVAEIPAPPAIATTGSRNSTATSQLPVVKDDITLPNKPAIPTVITPDSVDAPAKKVVAQPVSVPLNKSEQPTLPAEDEPKTPELELNNNSSNEPNAEIELPAAVDAPTDPVVLDQRPDNHQDIADQQPSQPHHSVARRIELPETSTKTPETVTTPPLPTTLPAQKHVSDDDLISTSYQSPIYYEPIQQIVPHEMAKIKRDQNLPKPAAIQTPPTPKFTRLRLFATTPPQQGQSLPPIASIKPVQRSIVSQQYSNSIATMQTKSKKVIAKTPKLPTLDINKLEATIHNVQRQANESSDFDEIIDR